ncbi:Spy/CpxP family protein refolding chaperone [Microvirga splendida]|uniref:Spy/CpxP family protein refolding chaperone n=1 Tax=Microvirga splendida TaxID=2795727 RepID=A0ABS0Y631_9HYPH|nr:Spy/CpxP family protein refolding chaperone [Microvirga splendida]MBJ6127766.1 Spy/CpxP family protein refolding chaperone [Microvirga splendida]
MKTVATLALAALLTGSGTYAMAQQTPAPAAPAAPQAQDQDQDQDRQDRRPRLSQDDFNRLVDARIASIKAGLKLTADQERLWAPVESAIRTAATERFTNMQERPDRDERRSMDFMQRLERRSGMMTERAQRSATVATALRPLWDTLTEDQKRIAPRLMREAVNEDSPRWHHRGGRRGHHGGYHRMGMMEHGRMGMMDHGRGGMDHGRMGGRGNMGHGGPGSPAQPQ